MDTSETRIKMCKKAEDIQRDWNPKYGDYIAGAWFIDQEDNIGDTWRGIVIKYDKETGLINTGGDILPYKDTHFWLPRQDQLQEMVEQEASTRFCHDFAYHFSQFVLHETVAVMRCSSMEQLWLAFVMKEKYNKTWDGQDWVKEQ